MTFNDNVQQVIDFRPILDGDLYGPLQDKKLFDQVEIDPDVHTLVWPNGADFDPATLHDWPEHAESMKSLANNGLAKCPASASTRQPNTAPLRGMLRDVHPGKVGRGGAGRWAADKQEV